MACSPLRISHSHFSLPFFQPPPLHLPSIRARNDADHPRPAQHPHHAPLQPQSPLNLLPRHPVLVPQHQRPPQRAHIHEPSPRAVRAWWRAPRAGEFALRFRGEAGARGEDLQRGVGGMRGELQVGGGGWALVLIGGR